MPDQKTCSLLRALASGVSAVLIRAGAAIKAGLFSFHRAHD
jgi:hypothetical protein